MSKCNDAQIGFRARISCRTMSPQIVYVHSHRGFGGHRNGWSARFEGDRNEYRTRWAVRFRVRLATRECDQASYEDSDASAQGLPSPYPERSLESVIDCIDPEVVSKE